MKLSDAVVLVTGGASGLGAAVVRQVAAEGGRVLIADLDAYQLTLYPPESVYALDLQSLLRPEVRFAVARDAAGGGRSCRRRDGAVPPEL